MQLVIVGAGFAGAVCAERISNGLGKKVLIVERRSHVGGNAFDFTDRHGVLIHGYGPHIFHTTDKTVWDYLSRFTAWRAYEHRVTAVIDGKTVPLPFNLDTLNALMPPAAARRMEEKLVSRFADGSHVPVLDLQHERDSDLRELGDFVYRKVFRNYTRKQWGLSPEELSPEVTARVPIRVSRDDRYFRDPYQGMPADGYTALFRRLLDNPNIEVRLNTDYSEVEAELRGRPLIFTGMIDELLGFRHGRLPYRSLRFRVRNFKRESFQGAGTVNYPNDHAYTRITEYKKLTGQSASTTTVAFEYPKPRKKKSDEAYYPIPQEKNRALYARYLEEAKVLPNAYFVGRLATYSYLNMDQVVASALSLAESLSARL
jgi:UDP-galactopyranose mutase